MTYNDTIPLMRSLRLSTCAPESVSVVDGIVMAGKLGAVARFADQAAAHAALVEAGWTPPPKAGDLSVLSHVYRRSLTGDEVDRLNRDPRV